MLRNKQTKAFEPKTKAIGNVDINIKELVLKKNSGFNTNS